jgi:imidazole glycerol-phosphate synthase subunit HisF
MNIRIIPRLDIKGPNLVKGINFEGLRVLGKPEDFAFYYYENGADELVYMDTVASLYRRNSLIDIVEKTSKKIFIPLTVGGGIRTLDDIKKILRAGADKVAINTAAIERPELIREASQKFGSSTIVVSIETMKNEQGWDEAFVDYGRQKTGVNAYEWALKASELGAGELMITSINKEGTGSGFELELIRKISSQVPIPVIAGGGAGNLDHIKLVIDEGKADAVSLASVLHYNYVQQQKQKKQVVYQEGNIEFLKSNTRSKFFSNIDNLSIKNIKTFLIKNGIQTRHYD